MNIIRVDESYNNKLIQSFYEQPIDGPIRIRIKRKEDFFAPYRILSDDFVTYTLIDSEDHILGMITLIFRKAFIENKEITIGYALDLRLPKEKSAKIYWLESFLSVIEKEREQRNCKYIFSVVTKEQAQSYSALMRPRANEKELPKYYLIRDFQFVNIHGIFPFSDKPLNTERVRKANESDKKELLDYILKDSENRSCRFSKTPKDLESEIKKWPNLNITDFVISRSAQGEIVGCAAPWSNRSLQKIEVLDYRPRTRAARESLQLFSYIGNARRMPLPGGSIKPIYITYLHARHPEVVYSLLNFCYQKTKKNELITYCHFDGHLLTTPPKSFIDSYINCGLYLILSPGDKLPNFAKPNSTQEPPDFEFAYI